MSSIGLMGRIELLRARFWFHPLLIQGIMLQFSARGLGPSSRIMILYVVEFNYIRYRGLYWVSAFYMNFCLYGQQIQPCPPQYFFVPFVILSYTTHKFFFGIHSPNSGNTITNQENRNMIYRNRCIETRG